MRLILTSNGLSNPTIVSALKKWMPDNIHIAFIPTAANLSGADKGWLVDNFVDCKKLGYLDIVDISAMDKAIWLPRLQKANVIVMGGGNSIRLMNCLKSSGIMDELPELLKSRVYVGISAGSIVAAKTIHAAQEFLYGDEVKNVPPGLGYVDFNIRPHLNSKYYPKCTDEVLKELAGKLPGDLYALDDESSIIYDNGKITVVSEGEWKLYKEK